MIQNLIHIKETADRHIRQIVEATGTRLEKSGTRYRACCPLHDEKTPSFYVNESKGFFKCFGCGAGGDALAFLVERERLDFPGAVARAAEILRIPIEYNGIEDLSKWREQHRKELDEKTALYNAAKACADAFHAKLLAPGPKYPGKKASGHLEDEILPAYDHAGRDWPADVVKSFLLGVYDIPPVKTDLAKRIGASLMLNRHVFPIQDLQGRVVGFTGRVTGKPEKGTPKYINSPEPAAGQVGIYHKSEVLYGLFQNEKAIRQQEHCYVVEGPTDVIALYTADLPAVAPCGTAFTTAQAKMLSRFTDRITLLFDTDDNQAGKKAARRALAGDNSIIPYFTDVQICFLPAGHDPDSYIRANPLMIGKYLSDHSEDAVIWSVVEGLNLSSIIGKKTAIDRTKEVFKHLDKEQRSLYGKELETRLQLPDLWRMIQPDAEAVDIDEIIKTAKDIQEATQTPKQVFPTDAFPKDTANVIREWAKEMLLPEDYFGLNILTVAGGVLGNKYVAGYKGRVEPALLYSVLVGYSGGGKTPTQKRCLEPVFEIEKDLKRRHDILMQNWKQECFELANSKSRETLPPAPGELELLIVDSTTEQIVKSLSCNPHGMISWQNELKGFLDAMGRYSSGGSLGFWLNMFDCTFLKNSRVGSGTVRLEFPFVPLLTGVQPGILKEMATDDKMDSGFFGRFIFAYPDDLDKKEETDVEPDPNTLARYGQIIKNLWALPSRIFPPLDGVNEWSVSRLVVKLSQEAASTYRLFKNISVRRYNAEETDQMKTIIVKGESIALRVALILHFLEYAEAFDQDSIKNENPDTIAGLPIQDHTMKNAIRLVEYFRHTASKVLSRLETPINTLPSEQKAWYESLPIEFATKTAVEVGQGLQISERTVKRLLSNKVFFIPVQRGNYRKRFE